MSAVEVSPIFSRHHPSWAVVRLNELDLTVAIGDTVEVSVEGCYSTGVLMETDTHYDLAYLEVDWAGFDTQNLHRKRRVDKPV